MNTYIAHVGGYHGYLCIEQTGSRWFAKRRNGNGFSSLMSLTVFEAASHDELWRQINGG